MYMLHASELVHFNSFISSPTPYVESVLVTRRYNNFKSVFTLRNKQKSNVKFSVEHKYVEERNTSRILTIVHFN